ncbi:hypothetical protein R3D73_005287 [Serratia marcescens]|nr:hypothetical protein [Serratia marcescens]ELQ9442372.1 hypothetical protein [Serratia marcescens]ELT5563132.1 hypothetical protein [Serratia marcescens]
MNETRQRHAYQRGVRMASLWKRLKGTILRWDSFWVSKARKHNLPAWIGHIPMSMLAVIMLAALVFGGMVIASSAVLVGALVLLVSRACFSEEKTPPEDDSEPCGNFMQEQSGYGKYRDGQHGWGWYDAVGRMVNDDE